MLVLTRKKYESIILDNDIKITVVEVEGNKVKLGIEAPADISIYREEVLQEVQKENVEALKKKVVIEKDFARQLKEFFQDNINDEK